MNGTSRKVLSIIDLRKSENALKFKNDGMVNSLYICQDGQKIVTGDSNGYLKTWDIRTGMSMVLLLFIKQNFYFILLFMIGNVLQSFLNEPTKKPISNIAVSKRSHGKKL